MELRPVTGAACIDNTAFTRVIKYNLTGVACMGICLRSTDMNADTYYLDNPNACGRLHKTSCLDGLSCRATEECLDYVDPGNIEHVKTQT